jgi:hypothetical protein
VSVSALALVVLAHAPLASAAGCPADARAEVNLAAWRMSLQQADSAERRDRLLAEVKLALDLPEPEAPDAPPPRVALLAIDDDAVQLEADGRAHHVLQIRYRVGGAEDAPTQYLVQVLRPLEGHAWCALGAELGRRDEEPARLVSYALTFVPLVNAKSKAIAIERVVAAPRSSETRREYWVARGFRLEKIFDAATDTMRSADGGGPSPTVSTVATLALTGGFPKRIEITETTKRGGCEVRAGDSPCDDATPAATTTTTFVYDGTRYARRK